MRCLWKPPLSYSSAEPIRRGRGFNTAFFRFIALAAFAVLQIACGQPADTPTVNSPGTVATTPGVPPAEDGQWPMASKNYESTRYSGLDEINTSNVAGLKVAWTFSTGVNRGQEAAPIVVGDTMYVVTPYPNILYALDLKNNGSVKWKYEPNPESASQGVACCDTVNRGAIYSNGRVFINTLDGQTCAVEAATGKEIWKTKLGNINIGETVTMAPIVVNNKVLVGNSGGEFGVRGWLAAVDANSGQLAWKAYSTGPDTDVLIGPNFKPFYDSDKGKDLGVHFGRQSSGRSAAGPLGGGSPTIRHRTSFSTAPATPASGTPSFAPATTNGPRGSSHAILTRARPFGSTRPARTTSSTTTRSTRTSSSISPSTAKTVK